MSEINPPDKANNPSKTASGTIGLAAILVGIALGVLLGLGYGKTMWIASGGLSEKVERLAEIQGQKEAFAVAAESKAKKLKEAGETASAKREENLAKRLREQIPVVTAEKTKLEKELATHQQKMGIPAEAGGDKPQPDSGYVWSMNVAETAFIFVSFFGDLFLQTLKLLVIPLVVTSMVCGITSLGDVRKLGKLGSRTLAYYFSTAGFAVLLGIVLVTLIQPGMVADDTFAYVEEKVSEKEGTTVLETLLNVFRGREGEPGTGMFPSNVFLAATETNVLALIVFAIVFGSCLTTVGPRGETVIRFFDGANEAVMKMVHLVMFFAPLGIFGLVAAKIAAQGGASAFGDELARIGWYVFTVLLGLSLHSLFLAFLLYVIGKRNPIAYTLGLTRALLTSMSTASSSATLPVTMECVEENNQVSARSSSFVLPLGATINMDGTALYEAVAVIFISQSMGYDLSMGQLVVIFLTATLAAVGAAGIPEAGLVTMVIVLQAVGLPLEGIGTILAIDWFLDRTRTTVNVYGDACGAAIIDQLVPESPPPA